MKLFKRTVTLLLSLILISSISTFFLAFYQNRKTNVSEFEVKKILSLLNEHNIKTKNDVLPKTYPDLPVIRLKNAVHEPLSFAKQILGKNFSVASPDTYIKTNRMVTIKENNFSVEFSEDTFLKNEFILTNPENYGNIIKKAVAKLGFDNSEIKIIVNNNEGYATIFKTIEGHPVFDCTFRMNFDDGISSVHGIWFEPSNQKSYKKHKSLTTLISHICQNSNFRGREITEITPGYKIGEISGYKKEVIATPVWRITFDDKITYDYEI